MESVIAGIIAFISTNIDDIFILMLFFADRSYKTRQVVTGQFVGIAALVVLSLAGSFADRLIDRSYIGLLGLLPIFFGIRALIGLLKGREEEPEIQQKGSGSNPVFIVASVTFANGGDNIGVYIPLFTTLSLNGKIIMALIFVLMTALWCAIGKYLSKHPVVARLVEKYGHIVTPVVLIFLGIYILFESGSFSLFSKG